MTPTKAMLDDLRQLTQVDPGKAMVNCYGVTPIDTVPPAKGARAKAEGRSGISDIIRIIYVSLYAEHKNLTTLLKAMPLLNRNGVWKFLLKTTVDPAWEGAAWTVTHKGDLALARHPDMAPWVEFVGPVNREQTHRLYEGEDVFVFPPL